ncbi:MAG: HIT family protein [Cytophagaceae bacterium]
MASIFTKIINGEIPAYKVAEDEHCLAFLDVYPLALGHTLVIPKKEIDYIFDIDDELFTRLHLFSKKVALGLKNAVPCLRVAVSVIGIEVPHAHIHLIPLNSMGDVNFSKNKLQFSKEVMEETADKIRANISL